MPTITEINPQIGDVVEYRPKCSNYPYKYTMDHNGLKGELTYLGESYFSGQNKGVDQFYVVSRAADEVKSGDKVKVKVVWKGFGEWALDSVEKLTDEAPKFVVGQSYKSYNGHKWEAIFSNGEHVWMKGEGDTYAAYVWSIEGKAISFGDEGPWDVDFGPIMALEMVQITDSNGWPIGVGEVTTKDGKPDWDTLEVKG